MVEQPPVKPSPLRCSHIYTSIAEHTLRSGGNVLVPCYPTGVLYDLLECLSRHLESRGLGTVCHGNVNSLRHSKNGLSHEIMYIHV